MSTSATETITSFLGGLIFFGGLAGWFGYNYITVAPSKLDVIAEQGIEYSRSTMQRITDGARSKGESVASVVLNCIGEQLDVISEIVVTSPKTKRILAWNEFTFGFGGASDFPGLLEYYKDDEKVKNAYYIADFQCEKKVEG